jgi:DNA-binding NarL/FixJ family response regulator
MAAKKPSVYTRWKLAIARRRKQEKELKETNREVLALRLVLHNEIYGTRNGRLTKREAAVLEGVTLHLTNKEIAQRLNVSERTVKFHMCSLMRKTGVDSRYDLQIGKELIQQYKSAKLEEVDSSPKAETRAAMA